MQESSLLAAGSGTGKSASPLVRPLAGLAHSLKHRGQDYQIVTGFLCQADGPSVRCQVTAGGKVIKEVVEPCQRESSEHRKRVVALHKAAIINVMSGVWAAPKPQTAPTPPVPAAPVAAPEQEISASHEAELPEAAAPASIQPPAVRADVAQTPLERVTAPVAASAVTSGAEAPPAPAAAAELAAAPQGNAPTKSPLVPVVEAVATAPSLSETYAEPQDVPAPALAQSTAQMAWEREATDGESVELGETTSSSDEIPTTSKPISSVEQARRLLAELSAMEAFAGLGVYGRSGQLVSSVVSSGLDMAELGKGYASLLEPLTKAMARVDPSDVHVVRIDTAQRIVAVASFEPYFHQLGLEISDALGFIVVVMNHDSPFDQVLPAVKTFMHLIVEDLRSFMIRRNAIN